MTDEIETPNLSIREEIGKYYKERNDSERRAYFNSFTAEDFESLLAYHKQKSTDPKHPEYETLLQKYLIYIKRVVESFERGKMRVAMLLFNSSTDYL